MKIRYRYLVLIIFLPALLLGNPNKGCSCDDNIIACDDEYFQNLVINRFAREDVEELIPIYYQSENSSCSSENLDEIFFGGSDSVSALITENTQGKIKIASSDSESATLKFRFLSLDSHSNPVEDELFVLSESCPFNISTSIAFSILSILKNENDHDYNSPLKVEKVEASDREFNFTSPIPSPFTVKLRFGAKIRRNMIKLPFASNLNNERKIKYSSMTNGEERPSGGITVTNCGEVVSKLNMLVSNFSPITKIADDEGIIKCRAKELNGSWYLETVVQTSEWSCSCDLKSCDTQNYDLWRASLNPNSINVTNASECAPSWFDIGSDKQSGTCNLAWWRDPTLNPQHWLLDVNWIDKSKGLCSDFSWTPQWWITFSLDGPPDESPWPIIGELIVP